jgi:hypothetical protein
MANFVIRPQNVRSPFALIEGLQVQPRDAMHCQAGRRVA